MSGFIGRFGRHNLTRQWCANSLPSQSGIKGFLLPQYTVAYINRRTKVESGIEWVRPVEPPSISKVKSGDLEGLPEIPPELPVPGLEKSDVLKKVDPTVQKMFTFSYQPKHVRKEMIRSAVIDKVKRHHWDDKSPEVKVAKLTANIRRMQIHCEKIPHDNRSRVILKESIERRKKKLKFLRQHDYKRFEWVLERLNLVYYPPPPVFHTVMRSVSMQQLTDEFCEKLKTERLAEYREQLENRKPEFLKRKMETMKAIIEDEKALKLSPSFSEEDILEVEKAYHEKVEELAKIEKPPEDIF